jgi:hypothetical protein
MVTLHLLSPFPGMAQAAQEDLQENKEQDGVSKPGTNPKVRRDCNLKNRNAARVTTRTDPVHEVSPGGGATEHHAPYASRTTTGGQIGKKQKGRPTLPRTLKYGLESASFKDMYLTPGQRVFCPFPVKLDKRGKAALRLYPPPF